MKGGHSAPRQGRRTSGRDRAPVRSVASRLPSRATQPRAAAIIIQAPLAVLTDRTSVTGAVVLRDLEGAARTLRVTLQVLKVRERLEAIPLPARWRYAWRTKVLTP